jgi:putative NADH-flavin reductase
VIFAIGIDSSRRTDLFSAVTAALLPAMRQAGARRLIAITGIGTGETRGHGGFFYDRVIFPLFTRHRYADKDKQEALIAASELDWTIVRPAPFKDRAGPGALETHTTIPPGLSLRAITRDEVASFVLDEAERGRYRRQKPFIGHR